MSDALDVILDPGEAMDLMLAPGGDALDIVLETGAVSTGGGGGVDDARVSALIEAALARVRPFAHWPVPVTPRVADLTLTAADIEGLGATRPRLLAAPGAGRFFVPVRLLIRKTGGPAAGGLNAARAQVLIAPSGAGAVVDSEAAVPSGHVLRLDLYTAARGAREARGLLRPGAYLDAITLGDGADGVVSGSGTPGTSVTGELRIIGYAPAQGGQSGAARWAGATGGLGDLRVRLLLEYWDVAV